MQRMRVVSKTITKFQRKRSSESDSIGETALHCAAEEGKSKIVELLIDRGALLNVLDKEGHSALHRAAKNEEDSDCVVRLVKAGPNAIN